MPLSPGQSSKSRLCIAYGACWLRVLACLALCALAGPGRALDPERAIAQYTHAWYRDQLPQNTVLAIVQRRDGSMWFATYSGIARHSGAEFAVYDKRSAPALDSVAITALLEDAKGTLWIGTLNGGLYRQDHADTTRVALPSEVDSVFGLALDAQNVVWLASNNGVLLLDASGVARYAPDAGFGRSPVRAMLADAEGTVWIATEGSGVARYREGRAELLGSAHGLPNDSALALRIDRDGVLWVGTRSGLARFRDGRFERSEAATALDALRIYSLLGDRDGNLWLTAEGRGLCRLRADALDCDAGIEGLSHDVVRSMLEDREGNLWIGATASGLHRLSDSKLATATGDLNSNSVRSVYEDTAGVLWAATDGAGLAYLSAGRLLPYAHNARLPTVFLRAVQGDAQGDLWIGSIAGLSRLEASGRITNYDTDSGLPGNIVYAIATRRDGGLWVGTSVGLARVHEGSVTPVAAAGEHDIRALHEDGSGRLWIGERSGLHCLSANRLDTCGSPDDLIGTSVFAFHESRADASMWLGTSNGLLRLRDGKLARYGVGQGLADDVVFTIQDDGAGYFWLSSNRGIARLVQDQIAALDSGRLAALQPNLFGKSDGMRSSQGNGAAQSPSWRLRDGRLAFATARGVVTVDPARMRSNTLAPQVRIERVVVDDRDYDALQTGRLDPGSAKLEFHYAAMSYVAPEALRYRYRLEGYDRDWVDVGGRRTAYYTNLAPGDYAFRVIASNNDGVWNEAGARYAFALAPHYYETLGFKTLLGLAAIAVLFALHRIRLWRMHANETELLRLVAARTEALHAANAELTRLASLDGLTRIANRSAFDAALAECWDAHRRRGAPLALLLCDIDYFKAYNDSYGHQAGDAALIAVASVLHAQVRPAQDLAARYGGEEFAVLLADCTQADAVALATRICAAVRALSIAHRASPVAAHITISIGVVAQIPDNHGAADETLSLADQALYRAKDLGRDRVVAAT